MGKMVAFATLLLSALFACNLPARALDLALAVEQALEDAA